MNKIAKASVKNQSVLTWQIINKVPERKSTDKSKLEENNDQDYLFKWKQRIWCQLGITPAVHDYPIQHIVNGEH